MSQPPENSTPDDSNSSGTPEESYAAGVVPDLRDLAPLGWAYHENSKIHTSNLAQVADAISEFVGDADEALQLLRSPKTYAGAERIPLPPRAILPKPRASLARTLARRRSVREYAGQPLSWRRLAALLDYAAGVTSELELSGGQRLSLRASPSGGALYPIEIYLAALQVNDIARGIYHFHPTARCLETVRRGDFRSQLEPLLLTADAKLAAPAVLILTACWRRPFMKYRERGYRVVLLETGHLAQNLQLTATALKLGACPLAGFHDDALAELLGLDVEKEPVLYVLTVGRHGRSGS